jgi:hypothetical protein
MIAIGRNKNLKTASYRLVSHADLTACIQKSHLYLCEAQQTLRKDLPGSCLGALFVQNEIGVHLHCRLESRPLQETTYQISSTRHLVYSPEPFFTQIQCSNGSHFQKQLIDITYIDLPPLCSVELVNSTITSNGNRRVSLDPVIFAWNLAPQHLPARLLDSSAHLDSQLRELRTNLTRFREYPNETISDSQFADLIHAHLTTPSYSSAIIWSVVLTLLISSLITFCIFFMYLRRYRQRRRSHRSSDVPMLDLAVNVAHPPAYQPPPMDYEDEIAYIARTGNVSGSTAATRPIIRGTSSRK